MVKYYSIIEQGILIKKYRMEHRPDHTDGSLWKDFLCLHKMPSFMRNEYIKCGFEGIHDVFVGRGADDRAFCHQFPGVFDLIFQFFLMSYKSVKDFILVYLYLRCPDGIGFCFYFSVWLDRFQERTAYYFG